MPRLKSRLEFIVGTAIGTVVLRITIAGSILICGDYSTELFRDTFRTIRLPTTFLTIFKENREAKGHWKNLSARIQGNIAKDHAVLWTFLVNYLKQSFSKGIREHPGNDNENENTEAG